MTADARIRITPDGQIWGQEKLIVTIDPGDQITLRIADGAYFVTIHRELYPGRRKEKDNQSRRLAPIRKVPMPKTEVQR